MAGTDKTRPDLSFTDREGAGPRPVVVLVRPQMGENIGAAARAMYNFGLAELRIVAPRDGWPSERAVAAASGATPILDGAKIFADFREAVAGLGTLYATTSRPRELSKEVITPEEAAQEIAREAPNALPAGLVFGGERAGLTNEQISLCDKVLAIPVNPAFASLNLAQAVLLVAYEWSRTWIRPRPTPEPKTDRDAPASREAVYGFFDHLEAELETTGFLFPPEKTPAMVRNIRSIFMRAGLTDQDVRTLRGIVKALAHARLRGGGERD